MLVPTTVTLRLLRLFMDTSCLSFCVIETYFTFFVVVQKIFCFITTLINACVTRKLENSLKYKKLIANLLLHTNFSVSIQTQLLFRTNFL